MEEVLRRSNDVKRRSSDQLPGEWIESYNGEFPEGTVAGGQVGSDKTYVARVLHKDVKSNTEWFIPAVLHPKDGYAYFSFECDFKKSSVYRCFCNCPVKWIDFSGGEEIPDRTIIGGFDKMEETIYFIGRVKHKDNILLGKYDKSQEVLFTPFQGKDLSFKNFELCVYDG